MNAAQSAAEAYVHCVNSKDLEGLIALFRSDASVLHRIGRFDGFDAIRGFYEEHIFPLATRIDGERFVTTDNDCVLEAVAAAESGLRTEIADVFTVGSDGLVTRLAIYLR
jgi:ketosteroid isomerase-like protein